MFTTHQDDDKEGDPSWQPCGVTLARISRVVVSVARAQNGDDRVRQRRRLKAAPMGDDDIGLVTVIIYEMLLHGPEKGPHKFKYFSSE